MTDGPRLDGARPDGARPDGRGRAGDWVDIAVLAERRFRDPDAIRRAYRDRCRAPAAWPERLLIIAADHVARGSLRIGERPMAMADRADLLRRLVVALARPGVHGVLATPDVLEDLLLLGALDHKVAIGSMNRGGVPGSVFEADDRFTAYDPASIQRCGLDAGKVLLRIDPEDPRSADALENCSRAVTALAERGLVCVLEPFWSRSGDDGLVNDLSTDAVIRAASIAAGLGVTSGYTWLKLPVTEDMPRVAAATSMPTMLLGGDVVADPDQMYARWEKALTLPTVRGLVVGRTLLYPPDDDVVTAVDTAASLLSGKTRA